MNTVKIDFNIFFNKKCQVKNYETGKILFEKIGNSLDCKEIVNNLNDNIMQEIINSVPVGEFYEDYLEFYTDIKEQSPPLTNYDLINFITDDYSIELIDDATEESTKKDYYYPIILIEWTNENTKIDIDPLKDNEFYLVTIPKRRQKDYFNWTEKEKEKLLFDNIETLKDFFFNLILDYWYFDKKVKIEIVSLKK